MKPKKSQFTYFRTGSSLTGDILSSSQNVTYIFEPLFEVKPFGHPVDYAKTWNTSVRAFANGYINKLFNCDNVIQKNSFFR